MTLSSLLGSTGNASSSTVWPNVGFAGKLFSAAAVVASEGSATLDRSEAKPFLALRRAYVQVRGPMTWDASSGWTITAVVRRTRAAASGRRLQQAASWEPILEFSKSGADAILLASDQATGQTWYTVTGPGGPSDTLVSDSFGNSSAALNWSEWQVLTVVTTASAYRLLLNGIEVASGAPRSAIGARSTLQGYIGWSAQPLAVLPAGLDVKQLLVWMKPLNTSQLGRATQGISTVWGVQLPLVIVPAPSALPRSPPPLVPAQPPTLMPLPPPLPPPPGPPPPPDTCGVFPGGWSGHCSSCSTGTCLRGTCSSGLAVSSDSSACLSCFALGILCRQECRKPIGPKKLPNEFSACWHRRAC
jgi:hypothetical protein